MRCSRSRTRALAVGVTLIALLSACAGQGSEGGGQKATDSDIKTFTYGLQAIPTTLDVSNNYDANAMAIMGLVTQPLEIANLDGTYTPVLAEKVSQPDDLTLVYDLRTDVTFSDGSPMTSADVVWTIDHLRGDTTQTASELTNFDSVTATGEHQVTITYKNTNPAQRGAFDIISFVQQKSYGEKSADKLGTPDAPPVGTGPYKIEAYSSGKLSLVRNAEYTGPKTSLDALDVVAVADDNAGQLAMRSGELDAIQVDDVKTADRWAKIPDASTFSTSALYLEYVTMNTQVAPFNDVNVRRAVAYATDRPGLLKANYGDQAKPNTSLVPPQVLKPVEPAGDSFADVMKSVPAYPFDLKKAKAELAQSKYPDGFTADYQYYSPAGKLVGVSLAENLSKIGITLNLKSRRFGDVIADGFTGKFPAIGFFSIAPVVPDPSSWYFYLAAKGNPYNTAQYTTPTATQAIKDIDGTDPAKRWEGVKTLTKAFAEDVPYVPLSQPNLVMAVGPGATFTKDPDFMVMTTGEWINYLKSTR